MVSNRYTYVHSDIRLVPKLAVHQQNALTDVRIPALRQYCAKLFNSSDKLKDQLTAVALALLDQGKIRALELAALTPDDVIIDGNVATLGGRKIFGCPKMLGAIEMMKRTTPGGMPLFSVPQQTTEKVNPLVRRLIGPNYLARVLDMQGLSLLGLQTYHGTISFSREVDRAIIQYQASWEQAVNHALMVVAKEWGHDLTVEPDPLRVLQLVQEVLVDPVVVQVMRQSAQDQRLIGTTPSLSMPPPTIPVSYVMIDAADRNAEEQEFSDWIHNVALHDFAEFDQQIVDPGAAEAVKALPIPDGVEGLFDIVKSDHEGLQAKKETVNRNGKTFEETYYTRTGDDTGGKPQGSAMGAEGATDGSPGEAPEDKPTKGKKPRLELPPDMPLTSDALYSHLLSQGFVESLPHLPFDTRDVHKTVPVIDPMTGQQMIKDVKDPDTGKVVGQEPVFDYTPERKKLHEKIFNQFISQGQPVDVTKQKPVAIVMMGGPGSGKSSATKGVQKDNFVPVDPDAIKEQLPEYEEAVKGKALNAARMVHEESSHIASLIRDAALAQNKNVLLDGVGSKLGAMQNRMQTLNQQGYHVRLLSVHLPLEEGMKRAAERALNNGRWVPMEFVQDAYSKIPGNFAKLTEHAHDAVAYDNNVPQGAKASIMYSKNNGAEQIHDPTRYSAYMGGYVEPEGTPGAPGPTPSGQGFSRSLLGSVRKHLHTEDRSTL
jgi:predicted ABC-type ATPase